MNKMYDAASASALMWLGVYLIASLFFFGNSISLFLLSLMYISFHILLGKRFKLLPNIILLSAITFAHLLVPQGRVLAQLGGLYITDQALLNGLEKAFLIIALIYVSRLLVKKDLRLPGYWGTLLAEVFYYFEQLMEQRFELTPKNWLGHVDSLLLDFDKKDIEQDTASDALQERHYGFLILLFFCHSTIILLGGFLELRFL